jgi:hypothetical protein
MFGSSQSPPYSPDVTITRATLVRSTPTEASATAPISQAQAAQIRDEIGALRQIISDFLYKFDEQQLQVNSMQREINMMREQFNAFGESLRLEYIEIRSLYRLFDELFTYNPRLVMPPPSRANPPPTISPLPLPPHNTFYHHERSHSQTAPNLPPAQLLPHTSSDNTILPGGVRMRAWPRTNS